MSRFRVCRGPAAIAAVLAVGSLAVSAAPAQAQFFSFGLRTRNFGLGFSSFAPRFGGHIGYPVRPVYGGFRGFAGQRYYRPYHRGSSVFFSLGFYDYYPYYGGYYPYYA